MAKRLTVLISDDLYNKMNAIKDAEEVLSVMEIIRTSLRLYLWYRDQIEHGFAVYARKEEGNKEIIREVML